MKDYIQMRNTAERRAQFNELGRRVCRTSDAAIVDAAFAIALAKAPAPKQTLSEAIQRIQYDAYFGVWAETPFTPQSHARFGRCEFEGGGLIGDGMEFFANGVEIGDYMLRHSDGASDLLSDEDWVAEAADFMIGEYEEDRVLHEAEAQEQ